MPDLDRSQAILTEAVKKRGISSRLSAPALQRARETHERTRTWIRKTPRDFARVIAAARRKPGSASPREEDEATSQGFSSIPPRKRTPQAEAAPQKQQPSFDPMNGNASVAQNPFAVDEATAFAPQSAPQIDDAQRNASQGNNSEENIPQRGMITQGINQLRFRKEIQALDKQLRDTIQERTAIEKSNKKKKTAFQKMHTRYKALKRRLLRLKVIKWLLVIFGVILSWCGIGEILGGISRVVKSAQKVTGLEFDAMEAKVKKEQKNQKEVEKKIDDTTKKEQQIRRNQRQLQNASLLSQPEQSGSEENSDIPLAA